VDTDTKLEPRDFPGNGTLKCDVCGHPYIEHEIKPCPVLNAEVIYAGRPNSGRTRPIADGTCRKCGEPAEVGKTGRISMYCSSFCRKTWSNQLRGRR